MQNIALLRLQINNLVTQARQDIFTLSNQDDPVMKQQILQRLWETMSSLHFLSELLANQAMTSLSCPPSQQQLPVDLRNTNQQQISPITPSPNQTSQQGNQRTFSIEELANYDGKNGRAAYVAVDDIVYDVTKNRAWAAASHFGLTAGKEHSGEFASCHAGQQSILDALPVVGRLG